jgi:solute carrier family 25 phosphate transporter 23/24/25/41
MLPRVATPNEIYKFYQVHKRFSDGRGAARVDKDGDPIPSFPKAPGSPEHSTAAGFLLPHDKHEPPVDDMDNLVDVDEDEEVQEDRHEAWRFLLAGGIAGGVSRSVTAPFDRLKVYLITSTEMPAGKQPGPFRAIHTLVDAMARIYKEGGGVRAFWVGNGLNVTKILPESAIKFVSYEQSKRFLAKYWDKVTDPADISSSSRFIAGGVGGITSQLAIYGLETLKTRIQSEMAPSGGWKTVVKIANNMYAEGGLRRFYRGLGVSRSSCLC